MDTSNKMLKSLFTSETRISLLAHFFLHPGDAFYLRQLGKLFNKPIGQLSRELLNLEKINLLKSFKDGNLKKYSINRAFPLYDELKRIFLKTLGSDNTIRKTIGALKGIELAFIFGSFAKGEEHAGSDIDIMIVGDVPDTGVSKVVGEIEKKLGRAVNYSLYERSEVKKRLKEKENFISTVFSEPRIMLVGDEADELFKADKR